MTRKRSTTLSGGIAIEEGDSGATVDGAGDAFSWGPLGALLLGELEDAARNHIAASAGWDFAAAAEAERAGGHNPDGALHIELSGQDASGLTDSARRLLEADGVRARRGSRAGTAAHEATVREVQAKLDPHNRGRPAGHDAAVADAARRLDIRRQDPETKAAIEDARARLTRRPGEPARRNRPSDPATWRGTEIESEAARKAIGNVGMRPAPKPPKKPQRPESGQNWSILKAHAGRPVPPGQPPSTGRTGVPPSQRRRAR